MILAELPPREVEDESVYQAAFGAWFHTGRNAIETVLTMPAGIPVAIDIETPSVTDSFSIKCVTAAWRQDGTIHAVLLDPLRRRTHAWAVAELTARADLLILHKSSFDVPGLVVHQLMRMADIAKVMDTLIFARSIWTETIIKKDLDSLASRLLGFDSKKERLKLAMRAGGYKSTADWFGRADIHVPAYRAGALADTVVTLKVSEPLFEAALSRQLDHPFAKYGCTTRQEASDLIMKAQRVNRVTLRRAARGYDVDLDYLDKYTDEVHAERIAAERTLTDIGLRPGVGMDVLKALDADGHLPANWPRTPPSKTFPEGQWKSNKDTLEEWLPDHPLASAHRLIMDTKRILGYMEKAAARSRITGRLHPQWEILGASATGRMSCSEPELQQFSERARPVLVNEKGLHSIDWSSIEPALLGWMSNDWEFITPFEQGGDIYQPIQISAGCTRKTAKVVVLAGMYGQGRAKLARGLGCTVDQAQQLQRQMRDAMPRAARFMGQIKQVADDYGLAITVSGRVLTVPRFNGAVASYKAVNETFQGSCADMIYDSILGAEAAGIGDALELFLHDEITCESWAAPELQRIMSTPSPELLRWTGGRYPVIRVDSQSMGRKWISC